MGILFFANSVLLGVGLAMDAFSVSLANGLNDPKMSKKRRLIIAGTFAFFQFAMPMIGWGCVHRIADRFKDFQKVIPFIALGLLLFIGGKMLIEAFRGTEETSSGRLSAGDLGLQGIATSIDALSVGFTIAGQGFISALVCCIIIAAVTLAICLAGLELGRKWGMKLAGKATALGGVILIGIGLEIFIKGVFFS